MATRARATVRLKFKSEKQLATVMEAIAPEAKAPVRRANVQLEQDSLLLILRVEAEDTIALRSTLNAYLRWINSAVNVITFVEQAVS